LRTTGTLAPEMQTAALVTRVGRRRRRPRTRCTNTKPTSLRILPTSTSTPSGRTTNFFPDGVRHEEAVHLRSARGAFCLQRRASCPPTGLQSGRHLPKRPGDSSAEKPARLSELETLDLRVCPDILGERPGNQISSQSISSASVTVTRSRNRSYPKRLREKNDFPDCRPGVAARLLFAYVEKVNPARAVCRQCKISEEAAARL